MHIRLGILIVLCATVWSFAGAPYYPDAVASVAEARQTNLLRMPVAVIAHEVGDLIPAAKYDLKRGVDCDAAAAADLRAAIGSGEGDVDSLLRLQASVRGGGPHPGIRAVGLPVEFDLYLRGYEAEQMGLNKEARRAWRDLLALPEDKRQFRSVWAAYKLGRSQQNTDYDAAAHWFATARQHADAGCADSIGLAAASIGWEARAHLDAGRTERAIALYLQQAAFDHDSAMLSLHIIARDAMWGDPRTLTRLARDEAARTVITAYVLGRVVWSTPWDRDLAADWLAILDEVGIADVQHAERLAWAAYDNADAMPGVRRWLSRAEDDEPFANWLRAEQKLKDNDLDGAADMLQQASDPWPRKYLTTNRTDEKAGKTSAGTSGGDATYLVLLEPQSRTRIELASLRLVQKRYTEALDLLLLAGCWLDAAAVAERVLTTDELMAWFADSDMPDNALYRSHLRHLIGRRLVRDKRFDEAKPFLPASAQQHLEVYANALADDPWSAAVVAREHGLELMGTELSPDWVVFDGNYQLADVYHTIQDQSVTRDVTNDEADRILASRPEHNERFHYRYVAADLAWEALTSLPENDDDTARKYCIAGSWLKARDSWAANRFYKGLVLRCGKTALGQEAARRRWFPPLAVVK